MSENLGHVEMTERPLNEKLEALFVNRADCYCVQTKRGYVKIEASLTDAVLLEHLGGEVTVGSYQLNAGNLVKWLCFDFDPEHLEKPRETVEKLLTVLFGTEEEEGTDEKKPRVWPQAVVLEASRYPDPSYHVWILFLLPVHAKVARWLGLRILELANLNPKKVEVFPKQTMLSKDRPYGNFVKLPLGFHQAEAKWSRILDFETFEPLPNSVLENVCGISFREADLLKIESFESKRDVQIAFELPKNFKPLSDEEEEEAVQFLCKYWREGARNRLEMYFLGLCLKQGVSFESANRIIEEVTTRTNDREKQTRLELVTYHYYNRRNMALKASSGIREIISELQQ